MAPVTICNNLGKDGKCKAVLCSGIEKETPYFGKKIKYPSLECLKNSFSGRLYLATLTFVGFGWLWEK